MHLGLQAPQNKVLDQLSLLFTLPPHMQREGKSYRAQTEPEVSMPAPHVSPRFPSEKRVLGTVHRGFSYYFCFFVFAFADFENYTDFQPHSPHRTQPTATIYSLPAWLPSPTEGGVVYTRLKRKSSQPTDHTTIPLKFVNDTELRLFLSTTYIAIPWSCALKGWYRYK